MALPRTLLQRWLEEHHACYEGCRAIGSRTFVEALRYIVSTGRHDWELWLVRTLVPSVFREATIAEQMAGRLRLMVNDVPDDGKLITLFPREIQDIEKKMRRNRGERWGRV